ncbi:hypothetical protein KI387_016240 [Taxus chinensis]|uniref:Root phototropism protein 3 n=1 Tax=Taxus chinensis TaxID=29808 RepID=A0AA38GEQ1_TAXCH|nr:hypothetical protein KI387_016240 [Taxus chinensis]
MWESENENQEGKGHSNCVINPLKHDMKADAFERRGRSWYVATDYPSDLVVEIQDVSFHLHKFPLLSKSGKLNRIIYDYRTDTEKDHIKLDEIPGGAESFELAAKFCYGVAIDLNASNISGLRCAAEYLEMTEDLEEGNLIFKTEAFLSYVVLSSWRDSIIVLKSCEQLSPWAENLQIVRRCSESIAWKACANTRGVKSWSYKSKSKSPSLSPGHWNDMKDSSPGRHQTTPVPPDWWFEDVSILRIDHFVRVLTAIKVKGMRFDLIGASIVHYASKWLPSDHAGSSPEDHGNSPFSGGLHLVVAGGKEDVPKAQSREQRLVVESLISIIPPQKDTVSCSFLLHLLKMANMLEVAPALVTELEKRVGMQLEQATLKDLLIPSFSKCETTYDVDVVRRLLEHFLVQEQTNEPPSPGRSASGDKHGSVVPNAQMRVARLVDSYLTEVARDRNLSLTKFQVLAEALPESARTSDDGLYRAIDSYLKAHPTLSEHERKRLCRVMDCQKLSLDACMHAAQNERLPLRIVVQVLFSEQIKITNAIASNGVSMAKETQNFYSQPNKSSVLENLPQSFQEGWSTAKKDINTVKFEMENIQSKFTQLQREFDNLNHQFEKLSKQKNVSAWSTGWKKLSKLKQTTSIFQSKTSMHDGGPHMDCAPHVPPEKQRRWRNSIS